VAPNKKPAKKSSNRKEGVKGEQVGGKIKAEVRERRTPFWKVIPSKITRVGKTEKKRLLDIRRTKGKSLKQTQPA